MENFTEYILIPWPQSQDYMDKEWFQDEACIGPESSFFIPAKRVHYFQKKLHNTLMKIASDFAENAAVDEIKSSDYERDFIYEGYNTEDTESKSVFSDDPDEFPVEINEIHFTDEAQEVFNRWYSYFKDELDKRLMYNES